MSQNPNPSPTPADQAGAAPSPSADTPAQGGAPAESNTPQEAARHLPPEIGGPKGPEPTRYGDWEQKGRVTDF
ncbi:DUF1674 domain-containing protein [Roseomonas elaeocarpi]|uniref:DUF1674 domain-containing protein n=1 Tax=Roseomonas elaeocarpi TaxID=907779 RepID=A0ABV6JZG4_9PROT